MRYFVLSLAFLIIMTLTAKNPLNAQEYAECEKIFKVMTFNIRFANPADAEYAWKQRRKMVANSIELHKPHLFGIQEGLHEQVLFLEETLDDYGWIGVGRDDGKKSGEYAAIFYRKNRVDVLDKGNFWLSEQPEVPGSKSWSTAVTRMCTWGKFRDKATGQVFYHFNTHWDHRSEDARQESAHLITSKVKSIAGDEFVILTGDMNATRDKQPYKTLMENFRDTRNLADKGHLGPDFTYVGFPYKPHPGKVIDYVLTRNIPESFTVDLHTTLTVHENGKYVSDHLPVMTLFSYN